MKKPQSIAETVRIHLIASGFGASEVARRSGVCRRAVQRLLAGKNISIENLTAVMYATGLRITKENP
jgi:DNA-binding phage protein